MKRIISIVITIALILSSGIGINSFGVRAANYGISNPRVSNGVSTWDCINFGSYTQSSDGNGDYKIEPIKWRVLSVNGDDAFLLSDKSLDAYDDESHPNESWDKCEFREWLNYSFFYTAFNPEEREIIKITNVSNPFNKIYPTVVGGVNTSDRLFLLSIDEATNYEFGFNENYNVVSDTRLCEATDYSKRNLGAMYKDNQYWFWALRTRGDGTSHASVFANGRINADGQDLDIDEAGLRPAMHIDLSKHLWTYAGTVSASGAGVGPNNSGNQQNKKSGTVSTKKTVTIIAKRKTFKKKVKIKKFICTLKSEKGILIKNQKVKLKIKGKTYTAKTNKKGKATFKIKLKRKGKYSAIIHYDGNKEYMSAEKKVKINIK